MSTLRLIYSTHPSPEQARQTADALLGENLVACCNLIPGMESHYICDGKREVGQETVMLSKTTQTQAASVIETIRRLHPYQCPAILELPVEGGNQAFLAWVEAACKPR